MPADQEFTVTIGVAGLNFRDQPSIVGLTGFIDSLNWRLDEDGAPTTRLGYDSYTDDVGSTLASPPLELFAYNERAIIAYCQNGHVYSSPGDGSWTSIASGLSADTPSFAILDDVLYWTNGVDHLQSWDGASLTSITAAPLGAYCCVWRNRLWIAGVDGSPHTVYWSSIGDPTSWPADNFAEIHGPHGDVITAITPAPNRDSQFDGADGVLVFTKSSLHRIYDDSDNVDGTITGGSNSLVDPSTGCVNARTIAQVNGIVYCVADDGIYATTGHSSLFLQSSKLGRFFSDQVSPAGKADMAAVSWKGSYLLAFTPLGSGSNSMALEVYTTLPQDPHDNQHPIMAYTVPVNAWVNLPNDNQGAHLYFSDSSPGNTNYVRRWASGGFDTTGIATSVPIKASARTGSSNFGIPHPKRVRRVQLTGRGNLTVGVISDFERGQGEPGSYQLTLDATGSQWGTMIWGVDDWTAPNDLNTRTRWFTRRGREFGLTLTTQSTDVSAGRDTLGIAGVPQGASAIYASVLCLTPLAADS